MEFIDFGVRLGTVVEGWLGGRGGRLGWPGRPVWTAGDGRGRPETSSKIGVSPSHHIRPDPLKSRPRRGLCTKSRKPAKTRIGQSSEKATLIFPNLERNLCGNGESGHRKLCNCRISMLKIDATLAFWHIDFHHSHTDCKVLNKSV